MHIHLEKTLKNSDLLVSCTYYFWRPTSIVLPPELSSIWLSESGSWGSPIRLRLGTPRDPAILCLLRAGITTHAVSHIASGDGTLPSEPFS